MRYNIKILFISFIILNIYGCKVDKNTKKPSPNTPDRDNEVIKKIVDCSKLVHGTFIQGITNKTIYYYSLNYHEMRTLKPFPNWYSYFKHIGDLKASGDIVPIRINVNDSCITNLLDNVPYTVELLEPYPNKAKIKINFNLKNTGIVYVNGTPISSGSERTLRTGLYVPPFEKGKNVIAIKTINNSGFGGAIANIYVNDCGKIGPDGLCDGTGFNFMTKKPDPINYTIPSDISSCFPLYVVKFNGSSFWGLSNTEVSGFTTREDMSGFSHIPEGYNQNDNSVGTGSLSGFTSPKWISSGIDHPYCGPEGYDWGSWDGENGNLYFKTIITCDFNYCQQYNVDSVTGTLFIP